ncbi:putative membrane protein AbrB (regulator of aidB expression) [Methylobacterium brachythecii]|uniref:Putative membrane protein AbrB (Regulator of aidB expression) n=1 Tax=Methylobacterium brachythecii TaxID=1176177 RepID=A0A7W6AJJ3_9HYPH|nr:putative membrane protein AbrB (regulator of aidB expression) [Methylobacterium brachythecii]
MVSCVQYTRLLSVAFLAGLVLAPMVNMMLP